MNERDEDRIEISLNDLEQKDAQPADDRLVITSNDLLDVPDTPVMPTIPSTLGGQMSGIGGAVPMAKSAAGRFAISTMLQNLIAGAIGGFLAWALQEPFFNESTGTHFAHVLMEMGIFGGIMGALIGVALGSVESILNHLAERALIGAAIGLGVGFGGGFLGGVVGQLVYSGLGGGGASSMGQQIMARSIGWAVVGTFVGLGQGIAIRSSRKIVNGLLGGLIGGAIGGVMFDLIGMMVGGGAASRAFAITATGACAGAAIGLVEELRKQAWLNVVQGWLAGKQFIIYKDSTIIGSSPKCDIPIFKDPQVLPQHALIRAENGRYSVHSLQSGAAIYVNQQPVSCRVLRKERGCNHHRRHNVQLQREGARLPASTAHARYLRKHMNRCPWYRQLVVKLSLLAVFVCLLSGCGTIDVSLKTIFNADGSGERIMHMVADGIFAVMLDDRSIDEEASKKGWTVERYNKDSQRHMVLKCKFKAADQIGASTPSLIHPSEEVQAKFGDYNPNVEFHVRPGFPYRIFAYRETIEPSPDMREDVCYDCDGKGYETCLACNGKGRNTCLECGGSGLVSFMGEQSTCPTCGGTGYIPCLLCSGQGRTVCSACGGTGKPGEMQRSIEQTVSEMIHIRNEVMLPGKVISTNADRRDGDALTWDITFERLVTGMTMQATSRQLNTPAVAVLSIGLLVIAVLLTIAIRMNAQR